MFTSATRTINNINTMSEPFHLNQIKQEQTQMFEQALFWSTHNDLCHGISDDLHGPCPNCIQISTADLLESITKAYGGKQESNLSPMERFLSPSPRDSPFPLHEKQGMKQNGLAYGSCESPEQRSKMVQGAVEKVAATIRQAGVSDVHVQGDRTERSQGREA